MNATDLNEEMIRALIDRGLADPWPNAMRTAPRHMFVPDIALYSPDDQDDQVIDREKDPAGWLRAAYADEAIITQLDYGHTAIETGEGKYTCSLSAPSIVAAMLALLSPEEGHRVLEIGTGTGWTAGLIAHVVGPEDVVSVEVDPELCYRAAENLQTAGYLIRPICRDGREGFPEGGPYDRIHITVAMDEIPEDLRVQLKEDGKIVAPLRGQLTTISGGEERTYGETSFMALRPEVEIDSR